MTTRGTLAGVMGWPVSQSLSPLLHTHWLREHGIAGAYVALPVAPENFAHVAGTLPLMGFAGANVTVPHKEAAFALARSHDEDARLTGAVNTLLFKDGSVRGLNTDVRGFGAALTEALGPDAARRGPAAVLGAGGAARAIVLALARAGASEIRLFNRTEARAEALARDAATMLPRGTRVTFHPWGEWGALAGAELLVNATSLGMTGKGALDLDLAALSAAAAVADIVYNPLETPLLRAARTRGHRTMDGLGMLMHQAVPAFAAWYGVTPDVTPSLRAKLVAALGRA